jgi:N-acetylglucosaminyldiphosphoundecaprenol N-acetyl-beta-D-mannosaminyltransferase
MNGAVAIHRYPPTTPHGEALSVLGVRLNPVTSDGVHRHIERVIDSKQKSLILNLNVHCVNLCLKHEWLKDFINQAHLVFCDGDGIRWAARLLGYTPPPKITYDRWIWQLAELADKRRYRLFFLGGKPGVAKEAAENLRQRFPTLQIAGTNHGYIQMQGDENERLIAKINDAKPDIFVIGLGMPRQEQWLRDNWTRVDCHVFLTGGAVFDYAAGRAKRAPAWMIRFQLEWLFRLMQEPRRLFRRYVCGNPYFLARVLQEKWLKRGME